MRTSLRAVRTGLLGLLLVAAPTGVLSAGDADGSPWRAFGPVHPRLSADGRRITFSYLGAIWRMPGEGGTMRRLTDGPGYDVRPAWSPDGERIAYLRGERFRGGALRLVDATTGEALPAPANVRGRGKLYFHPNGERLLGYLRAEDRNHDQWALRWLSLESGRMERVSKKGRRPFALSPDGQRIAYVTTQDEPGDQSGRHGPEADVWLVAADGGEREKLTRFPCRIYDLAWSADGALHVSTSFGGAHNDLWRIPVSDPGAAEKLTYGQADEDAPSLSRDGRHLLYTDNRRGPTALVRRNLTEGTERTLSVDARRFGAPTGRVRLSITDARTGRPLTGRVHLRREGGKMAAPTGRLYHVLLNGRGHFYVDGETSLTAPAGTYQLRVVRGTSYRVHASELTVEPDQTRTAKIELERWADPPSNGWYSGETHIHPNYGDGYWYRKPADLRIQCEGEALHVANLSVANSDTAGVFDEEFFRGGVDPRSGPRTILYYNEEFRATLWGHMTMVRLDHLVEPLYTGFAGTPHPWDVPTNADMARKAHRQGAHVSYTHPARSHEDPYRTAYAARALPVDAALGRVDSVDLNRRYEATVPLWHRLLNCGFRLPASAGTDCFLNRLPANVPGAHRAYAKVNGDFSYGAWVEGLRAGRSFITNGPTLRFAVAGRGLGQTVTLDEPQTLQVEGTARAQHALRRLELLYNGEAVARGEITDDGHSARLDQAVQLDRSGWLALRTAGAAEKNRTGYAPNGIHAHTSPIYVKVKGRPVKAAKDARYFLKWIDRLEAHVERRGRIPAERQMRHVRHQLDEARQVYRRLLRRSRNGNER